MYPILDVLSLSDANDASQYPANIFVCVFLLYTSACVLVCLMYFIIHNKCVYNFSDGVFCHVAHLCNAHIISGLLISASHQSLPIIFLTPLSSALFFSSRVLGMSLSVSSSGGAGVCLPFASSRLYSFIILFM